MTQNSAPSTNLLGRSVLVTGGNGGIGLGLALGCARAGASIEIWGTNESKLESARDRLAEVAGLVSVQRVDVSVEDQVVNAFAAAVSVHGRIDAVFANAGVGVGAPFVDQTLEMWRQVQSVNTEGAFLTLREAVRHMISTGSGGALIGVSSTSAIHGAPGMQPYAHSKGGLLAMMRGLSVELARYGIRANSIIPGWVETEMTEAGRQNEKFLTATTKRTPVRRWGTPDDFGAVAAFLADPAVSFHTGDEIVVDGGYTRF